MKRIIASIIKRIPDRMKAAIGLVIAIAAFIVVFRGVAYTLQGTPAASLTATSIASKELAARDKSEDIMPDFLTLAVRYDDQAVHITVVAHGIEKLGGSHIYMYGVHRDSISLFDETFNISRDNDADGYFEELIYLGGTEYYGSSSISVHIPIEYMPDISIKEIWVYSQESLDSLPDGAPNERLRFPAPSQ
jgi:hypothetical protein